MKSRLVLASHKGGVGKTTISLNLAIALATKGIKTALVELDPQGGLIFLLAGGNFEFPGLTQILDNKKILPQVLIKSKISNLSILSKGILHVENIPKFENIIYKYEYKLSNLLTLLEEDHDYIIIDAPTGLGKISRIALRLAKHVLIPVKPDITTLRSMCQILRLIDYIQKEENTELKILGILLNKVQESEKNDYQITGELRSHFPFVLSSYIPYSNLLEKACVKGVPISCLTKSSSTNALSFSPLANEIIALINRDVTHLSPKFITNLNDFEEARELAQNIYERLTIVKKEKNPLEYTVTKKAAEIHPPDINFNQENVYREDVWSKLLEWTLRISGLDKAFIIDDKGFIIAVSGGDDTLKKIETNFFKLISQLNQFNKTTEVMQIKLDDKWLSAFYLAFGKKKKEMIICLIGKKNLDNDIRKRIVKVFKEKSQ